MTVVVISDFMFNSKAIRDLQYDFQQKLKLEIKLTFIRRKSLEHKIIDYVRLSSLYLNFCSIAELYVIYLGCPIINIMLNRKFQLKETILSNSLFYSYPNSYSFLSSELFELNKSQVTSLAGLSFIGRLDKLLFRGAGFGFSSIGGKMSVILTAESLLSLIESEFDISFFFEEFSRLSDFSILFSLTDLAFNFLGEFFSETGFSFTASDLGESSFGWSSSPPLLSSSPSFGLSSPFSSSSGF